MKKEKLREREKEIKEAKRVAKSEKKAQLNILPLEGIQDFLRFTSMKSISQEPINKNSVIPRGLDHDPYICTNSC